MILTPEAAIREAEQALEEMKEDYVPRLRGMLAAMHAAVNASDFDELLSLAHDLKGEAGMMGWPLVSQVAGWLRQILEQRDGDPDPQVVSVFMQSLNRLAEPDLAAETKDGVRLVKELYSLCVSRDIEPA